MERLSHMLEDPGASGAYFLEESSSMSPVEIICREKGLAFFSIDGRNIDDKDAFLKEAALSLDFPEYFGNNWDALADCLTDMSWHEAEGFVVVYKHFDALADHSPEDFAAALDIFRESADYWRNQGKAMFILFCGKGPRPGDLQQVQP